MVTFANLDTLIKDDPPPPTIEVFFPKYATIVFDDSNAEPLVTTDNLLPGLVVPIPTLPDESIVNLLYPPLSASPFDPPDVVHK